jgi:hypothetical protein
MTKYRIRALKDNKIDKSPSLEQRKPPHYKGFDGLKAL